MQFFLPLCKANQENHTVYARAAAEEPDKAKEIMDYASAVPMFKAWSKQYEDATGGKSYGNVRAMHNPKHLSGKVEKLDFDDAGKFVGAMIKVLDPTDWIKVEEGGYTGISIGGGYAAKWPDPLLKGYTRYTPRISEISFVDSPCIPSARILELQKIDGTTEEVLLKGTPRLFDELVPPRTFADLEKANFGAIARGVGRLARGLGRAATAPARAGGRFGEFAGGMAGAHIAARGVGRNSSLADAGTAVYRGMNAGRKVGRAVGATAGAVGTGAAAVSVLRRKKPQDDYDALKQEILADLEKSGIGDLGRAAVTYASRGKTFSNVAKPGAARVTAHTKAGPVVVSDESKGGAAYTSRGKTFSPAVTKQEILAELEKAASPAEKAKIEQTMHEFKHGGLRSWRGVNAKGKPRRGPKVTDRRQAIAIALSQARRLGKGEDGAFIAAIANQLSKAA